jgi:hypothetical protein
MHTICKDLVASKQALQWAVLSPEWEEASRGTAHGEEFRLAVLAVGPAATGTCWPVARRFDFWKEVALAIEVAQPIADAIDQLEADPPLLSQALLVWNSLLAHGRAFEAAHAGAEYAGTAGVFERRFQRHSSDAMYAAYLLDPIFAEQQEDGTWMSGISRLSGEERSRAREYLKRFVQPSEHEALETELMRQQLEALPSHLADMASHLTKRTLVGAKVVVASVELRKSYHQVHAARDVLNSDGTVKTKGFPLTARCVENINECSECCFMQN